MTTICLSLKKGKVGIINYDSTRLETHAASLSVPPGVCRLCGRPVTITRSIIHPSAFKFVFVELSVKFQIAEQSKYQYRLLISVEI